MDGNYTVNWSNVTADVFYLEENHNGGSWHEVSILDFDEFSYNAIDQSDGSWCYHVKAVTSRGDSEWSNIECTIVDTVPDPPPIPSLFSISNTDGNGDYTIDWSSETGADSYELQEQYYNEGWNLIYNGTSTDHNISSREDGSWCYRVRSSNLGGNSDWSNIECTLVSPTLDPPPDPPGNLSATTITQTQIGLSWQDNSTDESEFRIERSPDGSSNWTQIGKVGENTESYISAGLSCDSTYFYRVKAYRDSDFQSSDYSNVASSPTAECSSLPPSLSMIYIPLSFRPIELSFDGPWEKEDNDSIPQANSPLISNIDYYGKHDDKNDYFGFEITSDGSIVLDVSSNLTAVDQNGYPVIQVQLFYQSSNNMIDYKYGSSAHIEYSGKAGWYFIRVYTVPGYLDGSKQYSLKVKYP
jgi:hypothetical protein